jgi:[acyl-carrier-protein] S-malonyltransferase
MPMTAVLFPGQGSQTPDMRETVMASAPDLLEQVIAAVGSDPFTQIDEGTAFAQPAIFCASLAGWRTLDESEREGADYFAGHSLGELGALVAAGWLTSEDGLALVTLRGALMQEAGESAGAGGMVAILGRDAAERAPDLAADHGLAVANDNSPQQVVLSGPRGCLSDAAAAAEAVGLRAMILPVTGAFHSPMMASAVPRFREALARVELQAGRGTVISAVTAEPFDDVRGRLLEALTRPVRWREVMLALHGRGVDRFLEVGPGRVLSGLAKRTVRDVELVSA